MGSSRLDWFRASRTVTVAPGNGPIAEERECTINMTLEGTWPRGKRSKMTRNYTRSPRTDKKDRAGGGGIGASNYSNNRHSRVCEAKPAFCPSLFPGKDELASLINIDEIRETVTVPKIARGPVIYERQRGRIRISSFPEGKGEKSTI